MFRLNNGIRFGETSFLPASIVKTTTYTSLCMSLSLCWSRPVWEGEGEREGELPSPELFCCSGRMVLSLVDLWEGKRREKGKEKGRKRREGGGEGGEKERVGEGRRGGGGRREGSGRREEKEVFQLQDNTSPTTRMAGEMTDILTLRGRTLRVPLDPLFHR